MTYEEDTKRLNSKAKGIVKCKCGHSVLFQVQTDRILCSWCNRFVYRKPSIEFAYNLLKTKKKIEKKH